MKAELLNFCIYCGKVKAKWLFNSGHQCNDCKVDRQRMTLQHQPLPDPVWNLPRAVRKSRTLERAAQGRICELYIGFQVPVRVIARMEKCTEHTVLNIISKYLGRGLPPVLMKISITDDIEPSDIS